MFRAYGVRLAISVHHLDRRGPCLELVAILTAVVLGDRAVVAGPLVAGDQPRVGRHEDRHAVDERFGSSTHSGFEDDFLSDGGVTLDFGQHVLGCRSFSHEGVTWNGRGRLGRRGGLGCAAFTATMKEHKCEA